MTLFWNEKKNQMKNYAKVFFSMQNYLVNSYLYHIGNKLREFIAFFMNSNETKKKERVSVAARERSLQWKVNVALARVDDGSC